MSVPITNCNARERNVNVKSGWNYLSSSKFRKKTKIATKPSKEDYLLEVENASTNNPKIIYSLQLCYAWVFMCSTQIQ